jgi:DNA-binding GntR family transcriptional regulator
MKIEAIEKQILASLKRPNAKALTPEELQNMIGCSRTDLNIATSHLIQQEVIVRSKNKQLQEAFMLTKKGYEGRK